MNHILTLVAFLLILPHSAIAQVDLPVAGGVVTSGVGWRLDPFGSGKLVYHRGTDIAVPVGTPVHATHGGRVVFAGIHGGYGETVIIEHDNGDKTLYGHNSSLTVRTGEQIEVGATIAFSGNSGRSTGPHIHFEVLPSGRSHVMIAQRKEVTGPQHPSNNDLRHQQEQRIEDAVTSILRNINSSSVLSGIAGQGG